MVHFEAICLGLMGSDDGEKLVFAQEALGKLVTEEVGAPSHLILFHQLLHGTRCVINRISPHQVTK